MPLRVIAALLGLFFFLQGINWLIDPGAAATALGMPLLDGIGRSTQVGDLSNFFLCLGGMAIYGAYRIAPTWLRASGLLVGGVAITRTLAWAFHGAEFASFFIGVEVIAGAAFFLIAARMDTTSSQTPA